MAIEKDNPLNEEEVDVEQEAVVSFPEEETGEQTEDNQDFFANIAEDVDERALQQLASDLISEYQNDKESRKDWEQTYTQGLDLLGFKYRMEQRPFKGASGVTHPLLAEAVTQFQAQAYKELLPSDGPVRTQVVGLKNQAVEQQAERVKDYLNYLIMEKMEEYTPEFDQMLFYLPLAGSTFKKVYYDALLERAVSKFVPAEDLVVPYFATDLKEAPRITHVIKQSENDLLKKMASGFYREVDLMKPEKKENKIQDKYNELEGIKPVETSLGFYGFGLIHMIGGLSRTATFALRQLLDAGTLSNLPAGFKARGMRIRDDDQPIQPGEFRDVDAPGGNIRDQFQLLPFKEPSPTLFQLLGFCVDAGRRFASIADMQVGDANQQAAVGTTIALLERGSRVMSAIHKRCYYAMKQEFNLLAKVVAEYLPPEYPYAVYGAERFIKVIDFDERVDILPVADPNIFSMSQRVTLAQTQLQIAQSNPQIHNMYEAYRRVYEALGTKQIQELLRPEITPVPKDPAIENMDAMQMQQLQAFPEQDHDAHIAAHSAFMKTRMVQINPPVYANLQGHISQHVSLKAAQEVNNMMAENPEMMQMAQMNPQAFQALLNSEIARRIAQITIELAQAESMEDNAKQDPIVMLKQRELDLRAMDLQRKAQESTMKTDNQTDQFEDRLEFDKLKLEQQDEQSDKRLEVARQKLEKQNGQKIRTRR
jgi:hypothetical protein